MQRLRLFWILVYLLLSFFFCFLVKIRCFNIVNTFFSSSKIKFDRSCNFLYNVMAEHHSFFCWIPVHCNWLIWYPPPTPPPIVLNSLAVFFLFIQYADYWLMLVIQYTLICGAQLQILSNFSRLRLMTDQAPYSLFWWKRTKTAQKCSIA